MISRTDIEDMTDAQDGARAQALREAVAICKRVRAEECENDDQAIGALECALAIQDAINAPAPARPSQAGDESVARIARSAALHEVDAMVEAFGAKRGNRWINRADLRAALAAMDTPKGGGDE